MNRREFLIKSLLGAGMAALPRALLAGTDSSRPPNIIFILADDLGLDGVGCYGSDRHRTPNLDSLANSGTRFEACYSTPLCGPTRCQLLTGRYPFRTGGLTNESAGAPKSADEISVARLLHDAGYATGHAGKWRQVGEDPGAWGFDEYVTDPTAGGWYWQKRYTRNGQLVQLDEEIYNPDVLHDFAVDFITRHKDKPFFFYYAMHLVHAPILETPDSRKGGNRYDENIAYMDKLVGKLLTELNRLELRENTIVLFAGDNGTVRAQASTIGGRTIHGSKHTLLEGGSRVPLIASWPGTTPAGAVAPDLVDFSDFLPTFAELAGAALPAGRAIDGHSLAARLRGQAGQSRDWVFVQLGAQWYVRNRPWKLTQAGELYDMAGAPFAETLVPDGEQLAARQQLQAVLDQLNPAAGKTAPAPAGRRRARRAARRAEK
jgi:arylsulfatase A-like enzyme